MVTAINLTAIIIASISILVSIASLCLVIGQRLSSHKIEWRPLVTKELEERELELEDQETEHNDEKLLESAISMSRKSKKDKDIDPLDEILQSHNF